MMKSQIRKPPHIASLLAATFVLTLLGAYALVLLQGRSLMKNLRESVTVVVEMRPSVQKAQLTEFENWLENLAFIKPNSITFMSKEDGAKVLKDQFGDDFLQSDLGNPLYNLYTFNLKEEAVASQHTNDLVQQINQHESSLGTYVEDELLQTLGHRVNTLAYVGAGIGLFLLLGVIFLYANTTRLALLSKATLIKNMELVGASWGFISRPFLNQALQYGALAGLFAGVACVSLSAFAKTYLPAIWSSISSVNYIGLTIVLILLGTFLNFTSTFAVIRKTLKMRVEDLSV